MFLYLLGVTWLACEAVYVEKRYDERYTAYGMSNLIRRCLYSTVANSVLTGIDNTLSHHTFPIFFSLVFVNPIRLVPVFPRYLSEMDGRIR